MRLGLLSIAAAVIVALPASGYQARPKSKKEQDALIKVQEAAQANNATAELAAIQNVLENFADTEFKAQLMNMALHAAQATGDEALVMTWAERITMSEPNNIDAHVTLAETTASHIRENDLDKAESVKKVNELGHKALDLLKAAATPPPGITDAQWPDYKKELTGRSWAALGQAATVDKKFPEAVKDYQTALEAFPGTTMTARLSKAYADNKQYDEAIASADKVLAAADASPQVKSYAQAQKDLATKQKGTK